MHTYTMEQEHGAVLHHKQVEPHQLSQPYSDATSLQPSQAPKLRYFIPRNQHVQRQGRECLQHIPFLRVDMPSLFPLSFVTLEL